MKEAPEIGGAGLPIPPPPFYVADLRWLGERLSGALVAAIRNGMLLAVPRPAWRQGICAIKCAFGLERRPHFFLTKPISWGRNFTEPQFTTGLAYFLNAADRTVRVRRVHALLKGLGVRVDGCLHDARTEAEARAETDAEAKAKERRRIDLLIHWQVDGQKKWHAAAVEAKVGHKVMPGQLEAYRDHLRRQGVDCRGRLVVVSPRRTKDVAEELGSDRNREWRWISWHSLLLAQERALRVEYDDEAYRQFRSTLWHQAGWS